MVKKVALFIYTIFVSTLNLVAQQQIEVPQEVKIQFMDEFISATNTTWDTDSVGNYKAEFLHQSQSKTAFYKNDGTWLCCETQLFLGQIPSSVSQSLTHAFKNYDIQEIIKIETRQNLSFRLKVRIKNAVYKIEMDETGAMKSRRKLYEIEQEG